ncbi:MAG: hypothetical protein IH962_04645 [Chloroflexi bacterium]|nr:hypothetical protein [Chloroflexota bacterium]
MYAMMADNEVAQVDGHTTGPAVNEWTMFPTGADTVTLDSYMRKSTTSNYFCWTAPGEVYAWSDDARLAGTPGECSPEP